MVFLDDLQWVDSASLKLIEHIITNADTRYLLLIGAYRDNEVSASHPLLQTLEDIRESRGDLAHHHPVSPVLPGFDASQCRYVSFG